MALTNPENLIILKGYQTRLQTLFSIDSKTMTDTQTTGPVEYKFQAEMSQLLHLITHSLYSHREIFLRELISNASDALSKLHYKALTSPELLKEEGELKIEIHLDEETKTLSIQDNGIGMSHEELIKNIGTIANSGTAGFVGQMTGDKQKDMELIGRFGVGFYAVFMIAEQVTVESKSALAEGNEGNRWVSEGTGTFEIEAITLEQPGTKISFKFKEDAEEFAHLQKIKDVIKKYSDFVNFPIELNGESANSSNAIWAKNKAEVTDEEYNEFFQYLGHSTGNSLEHLHMIAEAPVQFKSLLYVPESAPSNFFNPEDRDSKISLYVKKVFIQSDCKDLLPSWMRFISGVVDSEDLTLNVSREVTQNSPVMNKINNYLTKKLLALFAKWAKSDVEKYEKFYRAFSNYLKEGLHTDFSNREKLLELYRSATSKEPAGLVSLAQYVERMPEDQSEIYFVYGKSQASIETNPNLEYFQKNGIEVLYFYEDMDEFVLGGIGTYNEKPMVGIDKADLKLNKDSDDTPEGEEPKNSEADDQVIALFKSVLGEQVGDVIASSRLVDSPATLVAPKDSMGPQMERMMKMMDKGFAGSKRVMEINLSNPLIQNLGKIVAASPEDPILKDCVEQLFEGASLLEGNLEDPTQMVPRANRLMGVAAQLHLKTLEG